MYFLNNSQSKICCHAGQNGQNNKRISVYFCSTQNTPFLWQVKAVHNELNEGGDYNLSGYLYVCLMVNKVYCMNTLGESKGTHAYGGSC